MADTKQPAPTIIEHATCTRCGCVCDDVALSVVENRISEAAHACPLGSAWFTQQRSAEQPAAWINGQPASYAEALERAAQILAAARAPLIHGLTRTTCEAQRAAVALADLLAASIDSASSRGNAVLGGAFAAIGSSSATLGEIKNRADLLIYWGCDPAATHPRHLTRYTLTPQGMFTPGGAPDRSLIFVGVARPSALGEADTFVQIAPDSDFELLWALRALVKGKPLAASVSEATGLPLATIAELTQRMLGCRYGAFFFDEGLSLGRGGRFNTGALWGLVNDLNTHTHFVAQPLRGQGNLAGADNVLAWSTGYPYAVSFNRGYPRFGPGEFSSAALLARHEADAVLVVADDPAADMPAPALAELNRLPLILIGAEARALTQQARVAFSSATYGINSAGSVYRTDDIALELRPALPSPHPSDEDILHDLHERIVALMQQRS